MSYDLMLFEPSDAPKNKDEFEKWFTAQTKWGEGHDYNDPSITSPTLRAWFDEMRKTYPPLNGPFALSDEDFDKLTAEEEARATDYSIGKSVIYCAFAWSVAEKAARTVLRTAALHGVGVYDLSSGRIFYPKKQDVQTVQVTYSDEVYEGTSTLTLYEALELFDGMAWGKDSFLYFSMNKSQLFQIRAHRASGDQLTMEFTEMTGRDSFLQKQADKEVCREMLYEVFGKNHIEPTLQNGFAEMSVSKQNESMNKTIKTIVLIVSAAIIIGIIAYMMYVVFS